ncbi:uncharacterized protein J7T55_005922 [Diaporthe amygdali]|uniref:uncharacterized protein n=1 Tax=Phomopsis amygdali TaxID=1214568 RepID=UPI0022FDCE70|nr:uncharacterized protein J7T55_005922 [Diaporthe amygdali]KAJ0124583.1 uncharacterized protein J7T55_005922 [Diaporthe amygdali]
MAKKKWTVAHTSEEEGDIKNSYTKWMPKIVWLTDLPSKSKGSTIQEKLVRAYGDMISEAAYEYSAQHHKEEPLRAWYIRSRVHQTTTEQGDSEEDDPHITIFANRDPDAFKKDRDDNEFDYSGHVYVHIDEASGSPDRLLHPSEFEHGRFPVSGSESVCAPVVLWNNAEQEEDPEEYEPEVFGPNEKYYTTLGKGSNDEDAGKAAGSEVKNKKAKRKERKAAKANQGKHKGKGKAKVKDEGDDEGDEEGVEGNEDEDGE